MSSNITQYIDKIHEQTASMQDDMKNIFEAHQNHNDALAQTYQNKMADSYEKMKKTLESAIAATKNDHSAQGEKAYDSFKKALADLTQDEPQAGAVMLGRAFHALDDIDPIFH